MEANLEYGPGPLVGKPYRVAGFLERFLWRWYEFDPETGEFLYDDSLFGMAKGNSKSEFAGGDSLAELAGPVVPFQLPDGSWTGVPPTSPEVVVLASSYDQTNLVFGSAQEMAAGLAVEELLHIFEQQILLGSGDPGVLTRVAAVRGANDGKRPTSLIVDEYHEILGNKEGAVLVLENGLTKRQGRSLRITTAGFDKDSRCGKAYERGLRIASGEQNDPSFLFFWYEAEDHWDITDPDELRAAIRQANPAPWTDDERVAKRFEVDGMAEYEFRRYYLNQWTSADVAFLPAGTWDELADESVEVADGTRIVAKFDGSFNNDSSAVVACTVPDDGEQPHVFVVGLWEKPPNADSWLVPRGEIDKAVAEMFDRFRVEHLIVDARFWGDTADRWAGEYGEDRVLDEPNTRQRSAQNCAAFYTAVVQSGLTHDGDVGLARHLRNAVVKETPDGAYIVKDGRNSPRKIDAAVCATSAVRHALLVGEIDGSPPVVSFV